VFYGQHETLTAVVVDIGDHGSVELDADGRFKTASRARFVAAMKVPGFRVDREATRKAARKAAKRRGRGRK